MTAYEFVTDLERAVDWGWSRDCAEHAPVIVFEARRPFWGSVSIRPKMIGVTSDGYKRYQFTMNQARRLADILRGRE